jgi:exonuclease 3'-5' domain-containing protein 1
MMLLDFQGKGIGSTSGNLSLLQIGLTSKTFIVDAIALHDDIPQLAPFLQNRNIRKIVWDGRLGYSELWHRYAIRLENVLDLQLVYLHERYDVTQRKSIPLSGIMTAMKEKKLLPPTAVENELDSTC